MNNQCKLPRQTYSSTIPLGMEFITGAVDMLQTGKGHDRFPNEPLGTTKTLSCNGGYINMPKLFDIPFLGHMLGALQETYLFSLSREFRGIRTKSVPLFFIRVTGQLKQRKYHFRVEGMGYRDRRKGHLNHRLSSRVSTPTPSTCNLPFRKDFHLIHKNRCQFQLS